MQDEPANISSRLQSALNSREGKKGGRGEKTAVGRSREAWRPRMWEGGERRGKGAALVHVISAARYASARWVIGGRERPMGWGRRERGGGECDDSSFPLPLG